MVLWKLFWSFYYRRISPLGPRKKALVVATASFSFASLVILPLLLIFVQQGLILFEKRSAEEEIKRARTILKMDITQMDNLLSDWAVWDDSYSFALTPSEEFIETNLTDLTFIVNQLNIIIYLNTDGNILYARSYDPNTGQDTPPPQEFAAFLADNPSFIRIASSQQHINGLITVNGETILLAAQPILPSSKTGPASGVLIFGRYLNASVLDRFSKILRNPIQIQHGQTQSFSSDKLAAVNRPLTNPDDMIVSPLTVETLMGISRLTDIYGHETATMELTIQRDYARTVQNYIYLFSTAYLLIIELLCYIVFIAMEKAYRERKTSLENLQRYQVVIQQATDGIMLINEQKVVVDANKACHKILGVSRLINENLNKTLSINNQAINSAFLANLGEAGKKTSEEMYQLPDGNTIFLEISARRIQVSDDTLRCINLRDITSRKQAEKELIESQQRYELAVRGANDGIWDWDISTGVMFYSDRWIEMLGYSASEIKNESQEWFSRIHPDDQFKVRSLLLTHIQGGSNHFESEYRMMHKDGSYHWMLARGVAVFGEDGLAKRIAGSQSDITEQKKAEEQRVHEAFHDPLTGLPNRDLFNDHLRHANNRLKRKNSPNYAVLMLDINRFKNVNESYGHATGDRLLAEIARRLTAALRTTDTISHFDSDEFAILIEDLESANNLSTIYQRIQSVFNEPFLVENTEVFLSATVGTFIPEEYFENIENITRRSELAMDYAKRLSSVEPVLFHQEMVTNMNDRLTIESELVRAIERNEFQVYYQPVYNIDHVKIIGFEALVRWKNPNRGMISPVNFIPIAEESGLIVRIGKWVLEQACLQMVQWRKDFSWSNSFFMSVNLSNKQLLQPHIIQEIKEVLHTTQIPTEALWLEITETMVIDDVEAAANKVRRLRDMGIQIKVDDFGVGYSSLSRFDQLPVDGIKIDRSFVQNLENHGSDQSILTTILALAKQRNLDVIAEGVETENQRRKLLEFNCTKAQGYLFCKPLPSNEVTDMIRNDRFNH